MIRALALLAFAFLLAACGQKGPLRLPNAAAPAAPAPPAAPAAPPSSP
jgi:predicted small lipoprotein YifL